jgi:hypothetical protein
MEHPMIQLPAHYVSLDCEELVYLDGGWLSDQQAEVLLWGASALIASISLVPNVYLYIFDPIITPITSTIDNALNGMLNGVENFFKSIFG